MLLSFVSIYTFYSAATVLLRLPSAEAEARSTGGSLGKTSLERLQGRCATVRQVIVAASYLFGLVFFLMLPLATHIAGDSRTPMGLLILDNLVMYVAFAANVFAVFLLLHFIQWFMSARVHTVAVRCH